MSLYQRMHRLMLWVSAPFMGILIWLFMMNTHLILEQMDTIELKLDPSISEMYHTLVDKLNDSEEMAQQIHASIQNTVRRYSEVTEMTNQMYQTTSALQDRPLQIYNQRITLKLGERIGQISSDRIHMELYPISETNFSGYAVKVKLKTKDAMKLVLGKDKLGSSETTLQAVQRYGAAAGINAGGFADDPKTGGRYPLSTTILDGQYLNGFFPTYKDLFFVGINEDLKLIGGKFTEQEELDKLKPLFGVSFVPVLMENGQSLDIPAKWLTSPKRAARTVIANYKDDQLLFVIIEAGDEIGKSGATLPELQELLQYYGVVDAYNLDGGGSTTLVWNNKVMNHPSDGVLRPLATHFLFFK